VSAQASASPGRASASASCSGAANCRHSYSASATAHAEHPSGSYADANASGSGGGGQGSGGVSVAASADAGDGYARASASCAGAANCSVNYKAHASLTRTSPAGETAHGEGTCSGTTNGGCGVVAKVSFGPNGGGGADCFGNCGNFTQSGWLRPPSGMGYDDSGNLVRVGKDGKPIPIEELGADERAVQGTTENGVPTLKIKPKGGGVQTYPCPTSPCSVTLPSGEKIEYDPGKGGYHGELPVDGDKPDGKRDTATGTEGARISRDAKGNGGGWIRGTGQVTNGVTGEKVDYTGEVPSPVVDGHSFRLTNPGTGSPFSAHCGAACEYKGAPVAGAPQVDNLVLTTGSADITGRDAHGNSAVITFNGTGKFVSAEGDRLTGRFGDGFATGRASIVTRGADGYGGHFTIEGTGTVRSAEGVEMACVGTCTGTHWMPTAKGLGGITMCQLGGVGSCVGIGSGKQGGLADVQGAEIKPGDTVTIGFLQRLRNDDGSGGGATAFILGGEDAQGGLVYGMDALGNHISTTGVGGRTTLLYSEIDGYNHGQSCRAGAGGSCTGSDPAERRLPWVEPNIDVFRSARFGNDFIGPVANPTFRQQADLALDFATGQGHLRWMAETGNEQLTPVTEAYEKAKAGGISEAEATALAKQIDALDPKLRTRLGRTGDAQDIVVAVQGTQRTVEDVERQLAKDPQLVASVLGRQLGDSGKPSEQELTEAKTKVLAQQAESVEALKGLSGFSAEDKALSDRITKYEQAVRTYNAGGEGDPAALDKERLAIKSAVRDLDRRKQPYRDDLAASQGVLRTYDLATAVAGGDRSYAADIELAGRNLAAVEGVVEKLPEGVNADTATTIAAFSDAVRLGYEAAIAAPRTTANRLNDLELPSTGSADLPLAMRSAVAYDYIEKLVKSANSPFVNADGSDYNPDQIANLAAHWVYRGEGGALPRSPSAIAAQLALPVNAAQATDLLVGQFGEENRAELEKALLKQINHSGLVSDAASVLSEGEEDKLRDVINEHDPKSVAGFFEFMLDGAGLLQSEAVRNYNRKFGTGTDSFARNFGRGAVTLGTGLLALPGTVIGGAGVEVNNSFERNGVLKTLAAGPIWADYLPFNDPTRTGPSAAPRKPDQTWAEHYTASHPLTGGLVVTPVRNSLHRWVGKGDVSDDYHDRPVESFMEDALPLLIVAGPLTAGMRSGAVAAASRAAAARTVLRGLPGDLARSTEAGALRTTATRLEARAQRLDVASRIPGAVAGAASAPFRPVTGATRLVAGGVRAVAVPLAKATAAGARAAGMRAIGGFISGLPTAPVWGRVSTGLGATSKGLGAAAETARATVRNGWLGRNGRAAAYQDLGVRRAASEMTVAQAIADRMSQQVKGAGGDPVLAARLARYPEAIRIVEADRTAMAARGAADVTIPAALTEALNESTGARERAGDGDPAATGPAPRAATTEMRIETGTPDAARVAELRKQIEDGRQQLAEAGRKGQEEPAGVREQTLEAHRLLDEEAANWTPEEQARTLEERLTERLWTETSYGRARPAAAPESAGPPAATAKKLLTVREKVVARTRAWATWVGMTFMLLAPTVGADGLAAAIRAERPSVVMTTGIGGRATPVVDAVAAATSERAAAAAASRGVLGAADGLASRGRPAAEPQPPAAGKASRGAPGERAGEAARPGAQGTGTPRTGKPGASAQGVDLAAPRTAVRVTQDTGALGASGTAAAGSGSGAAVPRIAVPSLRNSPPAGPGPGAPLYNWLRTKALMETVNPRVFESTSKVPSLRGLVRGLVGPMDPVLQTRATGYTAKQWRKLSPAERTTALDAQADKIAAAGRETTAEARAMREKADKLERKAAAPQVVNGHRIRAGLPRGPREPGRRPWVSWQQDVDRAPASGVPPVERDRMLQQAGRAAAGRREPRRGRRADAARRRRGHLVRRRAPGRRGGPGGARCRCAGRVRAPPRGRGGPRRGGRTARSGAGPAAGHRGRAGPRDRGRRADPLRRRARPGLGQAHPAERAGSPAGGRGRRPARPCRHPRAAGRRAARAGQRGRDHRHQERSGHEPDRRGRGRWGVDGADRRRDRGAGRRSRGPVLIAVGATAVVVAALVKLVGSMVRSRGPPEVRDILRASLARTAATLVAMGILFLSSPIALAPNTTHVHMPVPVATSTAVEQGSAAQQGPAVEQDAVMAPPADRTWQVRAAEGDTVSALERGLRLGAGSLAGANPGRFPTRQSLDDIRAGEWFDLPPGAGRTYWSVRGDTLTEIAYRFDVRVSELAQAQGDRFPTVRSRDSINIGERFVIPGREAAQVPPSARPELPPTGSPLPPDERKDPPHQDPSAGGVAQPPAAGPADEKFAMPDWWPGSLRQALGWLSVVAGALLARRTLAKVVPGGLLGGLLAVGKGAKWVGAALVALPGRIATARDKARDSAAAQREAIARLNGVVSQGGPGDRRVRAMLPWAMELAARTGLTPAEIGRVVGLDERVVALLLGHRDTVRRCLRPGAGSGRVRPGDRTRPLRPPQRELQPNCAP
jgi:hypothetical protein